MGLQTLTLFGHSTSSRGAENFITAQKVLFLRRRLGRFPNCPAQMCIAGTWPEPVHPSQN